MKVSLLNLILRWFRSVLRRLWDRCASLLLLVNAILLACTCCVSYGLWLYSHALAYVVCGGVIGLAAFVTGVAIGVKPRTQPIQRGRQDDRVRPD